MPDESFRDLVAAECLTCRFWEPEEGQEEPTLGECRRAEAGRTPAGRQDVTQPLAWLPRGGGWRLTDGRDWCQSWRLAA